MSFFRSFAHFISCKFGLTRPELGDTVIQKETEHLSKWDKAFIDKNKNYVDTDYKNFVDYEYPNFITTHKYTFVETNSFPAKDRPRYSLALSGGGIRSAAFGIGVIQALNNVGLANAELTNNAPDEKEESQISEQLEKLQKPTIFTKLVYLSTVSGGGYAGAALSWFMKKWDVYPFGEIESSSGSKAERPDNKSMDFVGCYTDSITSFVSPKKNTRNEQSSVNESQGRDGQLTQQQKISSNKILAHIRLHGKYLSPPELPLSSVIGSVINSSLHSFMAYTILLSAFFIYMFFIIEDLLPLLPYQTDYVYILIDVYKGIIDAIKNILSLDQATNLTSINEIISSYEERKNNTRFSFFISFFLLASTSILIFLFITFTYGMTTYFTGIFNDNYRLRVRVQKTLGFLIKITFLSILLMVIPLQIEFFNSFISKILVGPGAGAGIIALLMSVNEFRKQLQSSTDTNTRYGNILRDIIALLFIYLFVTLSFIIGERLYITFSDNWMFYLIIPMYFVMVVNINLISPHRMYRDRLLDTFLTDPNKNIYDPIAEKGRMANKYLLAEVDESNHWAPYHLINTNIILNNSRNSQYNSRIGDSFVLSPKYCGSDATGYVPTKDFAFGTMTLATATSISGAAANPHSGVGGVGDSTTPLVSFLMTFFGLRLGYWANNPKHILSRFKWFFKPNYFIPGSFSLLNYGHTENSSYIELSDGGHFDNTGIYELIRRRMPWIILSDGSADSKATFEDLGNALSRIRIDFGVTIRFNDPDLDLCGLVPGSQTESTFDKKFNLSARGFAIGDIVYPATHTDPGFIGTFVYIKATMTRDLPGDIYAYQADHPEFPNEPTSDQFFNERQFESYRELGYQITKQLLQSKTAMERLP